MAAAEAATPSSSESVLSVIAVENEVGGAEAEAEAEAARDCAADDDGGEERTENEGAGAPLSGDRSDDSHLRARRESLGGEGGRGGDWGGGGDSAAAVPGGGAKTAAELEGGDSSDATSKATAAAEGEEEAAAAASSAPPPAAFRSCSGARASASRPRAAGGASGMIVSGGCCCCWSLLSLLLSLLLLLSVAADAEVEVERRRPSGDGDDDAAIFAAFLVLVSAFRGAPSRRCIRHDRADLIVLVESESKLFYPPKRESKKRRERRFFPFNRGRLALSSLFPFSSFEELFLLFFARNKTTQIGITPERDSTTERRRENARRKSGSDAAFCVLLAFIGRELRKVREREDDLLLTPLSLLLPFQRDQFPNSAVSERR